MTTKIQKKYKDLCAELGDVQYKLSVLTDKKQQITADIQALDRLVGELLAETKPAASVPLK
jgi:hypothetical protein